MGRYINPFTDWGFKQIFGQEANKEIIIFFLNELLKGERVIKDLTFLDKERLGDHDYDRNLIYDVYCLTDTGEHIIVEMQNRQQAYFIDRSLYYVSKAIVSQPKKGVTDYKLTAVYGVFFMNFTLNDKLGEKLRTDVVVADRETGVTVSDKMRMIFLQLPYFDKKEDECENDFERFIYVLKKMAALDRLPFEKRNQIFARLAEIAEVRKYSEQEQLAYDRSLKSYIDNQAVLQGAIDEGLTIGRKEGREEGREEGLAEGIAKGRMEERQAIARSMKEAGMEKALISKISGLTEEEIDRL